MEDSEKSAEQIKFEKMGAFYNRMANTGSGVHPDAGHDYDTANKRDKAYPRTLPLARTF